jgi:hypothetical protein
MSTESHIYYGFSLTEDYDKIQEVLGEILDDEGFNLQDYVWENEIGESHYNGGGYGQVTCVGKDIPETDRGYVVTDEIIAEVKSMIANLPSEFQKALKEVVGSQSF